MKSFEKIHSNILCVITENAYMDKRKEISSNPKLTPIEKASHLAKAASDVANEYTIKYKKLISGGSLAHIHNLAVVSARAQSAHITASHNYDEGSPGHKVHMNAAIDHQVVLDFCKKAVTNK